MSAFVVLGRIGMINKGLIEYLIQFLKNDVMNQSVFNFGLMYYPVLWVINMEFNIRIVIIA